MIKLNKQYRHFKGNIYIPLHIGRDSETEQEVVIYQNVKHNDIWVRPISMWDEIIDEKGTRRFTLIEEE